MEATSFEPIQNASTEGKHGTYMRLALDLVGQKRSSKSPVADILTRQSKHCSLTRLPWDVFLCIKTKSLGRA